jgi:hypothetical protein
MSPDEIPVWFAILVSVIGWPTIFVLKLREIRRD